MVGLVAASLLCLGSGGVAALASGTAATLGLTAGGLGWVSNPGGIAFTTTLSGYDQAVSASLPLDVDDATGSGTGWNITATSTTFATHGASLTTTATTVPSTPPATCDAGATCTLYASTGVAYPYTLPAAAAPPAATKVVAAAAGSGTGQQTVTVPFIVAVPGGTTAGSYVATWTISLAAGP